ncbi:hypothetical protein R4Y45_07040 [Holzapfeliella sp. He02]|uniref:Uncharacterized protein n=1 Tax=Holzapfeliella saturejae TaxID=3082953 RepID=A0ABU8SHV8_9LACO
MDFIEKTQIFIKQHYSNQPSKVKKPIYNQIKVKKYHKYPKSRAKNKSISDYELGYTYAHSDLKKMKQFRTFSKNSVHLVKTMTQGKAVEISQFIKGYTDAKQNVK